MFHTRRALLASFLAAILLSSCQPKPHPGSINDFDSASYDTLTAAHSILVTMRGQVRNIYPKYKPTFDVVANAYRTAYSAYILYRSAPSGGTLQVTIALTNLTTAVVALETSLQQDMHVTASDVNRIRSHVMQRRAMMAGPRYSLADLLAELQIAAQVAETIPGTQPWSNIASLVIQLTQRAVSDLQKQSGQPIDVMLIQPVAAL